MKRRDQRINIMIVLYQHLLIGADINELVENQFKESFENIDDFSKEILDFALSCENELIEITNSRLDEWTFDRLGFVEQGLILMALSEIALDNTSKAIIINEAVEIAKIYCDDDAFKLLNGVLDK